MQILRPCHKPFCAFYEEMTIEKNKPLTNTAMPHIFGQGARVCVACVHFQKFDFYEASDTYQPGKVNP
jgi:hypothetical protein